MRILEALSSFKILLGGGPMFCVIRYEFQVWIEFLC